MKVYQIGQVLITPRQLERRVAELAVEIAAGAEAVGAPLVVVGLLKGSFVFLADLVRCFWVNDLHPQIDFMIMCSYGHGTCPDGEPRVERDCTVDVTGADVVLVDDILDTGRTLQKAAAHLRAKGARRVRTCVLLDKPSRRVVECKADHTGFVIEDAFVVGYGLDYDGRHRELPHIAQVVFNAEEKA